MPSHSSQEKFADLRKRAFSIRSSQLNIALQKAGSVEDMTALKNEVAKACNLSSQQFTARHSQMFRQSFYEDCKPSFDQLWLSDAGVREEFGHDQSVFNSFLEMAIRTA